MMKNGVHAPEQDGGDSKRQRITRTDGASAPAAENTAMQECFENPKIFVHILRFANNPSASRVCQNFYNPQEEALRLDYNQNKEPHRPDFYYDKDKDSNEATAEQQVEVEYLLSHEADILEKTDNNETIKACFAKLKEAQYLNIKPVETIKFIAREKFLGELNAAIINAQILKSKRDDATILDCESCHLTRFPGKVITQHLDYFKALQKFRLNYNKLQSLPREIGQLAALRRLYLKNNQLKSLPPEIGLLVVLQWLMLTGNQLQSLPPEIRQLAALQRLNLRFNQLKNLPREIGQLAALLELNLGYNQLQSLPHEIGQLAALKWLHLDNNQFKNLPSEIGQLTALEWFHLRDNQLQSLPPEIGQLTALQVLILYHNQLQSLPDDLRENILKDDHFQTATKAKILSLQRKPSSSDDEEVRRSPRPS